MTFKTPTHTYGLMLQLSVLIISSVSLRDIVYCYTHEPQLLLPRRRRQQEMKLLCNVIMVLIKNRALAEFI